MKTIPYLFALTIIVFSCKTEGENVGQNSDKSAPIDTFRVLATVETDAVSADPEDDAADDPALWYNYQTPENSLLIGSDKKNGIDVYSMEGERLNTYRVGPINNVDVRQKVLGGIDVVAGTNRTQVAIDFWKVIGDSSSLKHIGSIKSNLPDVYGFCLHHSKATGELYAFVNSKTGRIEQWSVDLENDLVIGTLVRELSLPTQVEGMVADDDLDILFVGEEAGGIHKFSTDEAGETSSEKIELSDESNPEIQFDIEGLAIYKLQDEKGYLIASSQGNNSFAVFERTGSNRYIGSFEIHNGEIDGAEETDGIEALSMPLGAKYPNGVFVCQDGFNYEGDTKIAQNFKIIPWESIARKLSLQVSGN